MNLEFHGRPAYIVPGLHGSGQGHWQTVWQQRHAELKRIEQDNWDIPFLPAWSQRVSDVLSLNNDPAVLIAPSFGCLASVHAALHRNAPIAAALLVAPADPAKFGVEEQLTCGMLGFPSIVIASGNDPWMSIERARAWSRLWCAEFVDAGRLGHINADSGLGAWEAGVGLLQRLIEGLPIRSQASPA